MRLALPGVGAVAVAVLASSGCSTRFGERGRGERVAASSQAIQDGTTNTTDKYAVGVCQGTAGNCKAICSGALILPNVVATARHCVSDSDSIIDCSKNPTFGARKPDSFSVTTNVSMSGNPGSGWYGVRLIEFPDDDHLCGNDIALLILNSPVPSSVTGPITPGVQYEMWDPDRYVPAFTAIGYGRTKPDGKDSGTRRSKDNISILCVPGSDDMECPPHVNQKEFLGGDGTCPGDSGSSAFDSVTYENGAPVSFGVLSRVKTSDDGTRCESSVYTRFDAHRDFVLKIAKIASNDWKDYPEPSWTAYMPPRKPKPKDAGAPDSGPTTEPSGLALGDSCESGDECSSGVCEDAGDGTYICTKACDDTSDTSCPSGYECRENLCLPPAPPPTAPAATTTTTTTTGCAATPGTASSSASWSVALLGAAIAVVAGRGRKRR